jgi:hypothetical protein
MIYALVRDGEILRRMDFSVTPPELPAAKGMKWYPLVDTPRPEYNSKTHGLRESPPLLDDACTLQWEVFPLPAEEVEAIAASKAAQARAQAKGRRAEAVQAITVTTQAGNTFDGDETSQNRMARAVIALNAAGVASVPWTLADNSVVPATAAELAEALALAGAAQSALWALA